MRKRCVVTPHAPSAFCKARPVLGLLAGGLLATIDWRAVFWVSAPIGVVGAAWSYRGLRDTGTRSPGWIDWAGNLIFTAGDGALLVAITYGIQPYGGHSAGWTSPWVLGGLGAGVPLLAGFSPRELTKGHVTRLLNVTRFAEAIREDAL